VVETVYNYHVLLDYYLVAEAGDDTDKSEYLLPWQSYMVNPQASKLLVACDFVRHCCWEGKDDI